MKLLDILKTVGGGVIKAVVPGGGLLVDTVNAILDPDKQLPKDATGKQMASAINGLSSADRAKLMSREFDVEATRIREGNQTLRTMLESERGESTRPRIALGCFRTISFCNVVFVGIWGYATVTNNETMVGIIADSWQFIAAINAPLVAVLLSYFGNLVKEKKNKLDAANGSTHPSGIAGLLTGLFSK